VSVNLDIYQQIILEHNKKPRNFRQLEGATHSAEGFNPLCGDHIWIYLIVDENGVILDVTFQGQGCAICKASASMMTVSIRGGTMVSAQKMFGEFHSLLLGEWDPETKEHTLGKLKIFAGIWQYPSRVKCASLAWHTMSGALCKVKTISTE
jgi:nitrogen fixation protein NifU and related proteins